MSREQELETLSKKRADHVIKNLRRRGMEGFFAKDKDEANRKILSLLAPGSSVAWGGSVTLARDLKTLDLVRNGGFKAIDREAAKTPEEIERVYRDAFFADTYLLSANAITLDGKIVNVDGRGNRVAAMAYGPRQVILAVGCNKICPSLETALERARTEAAPLNTERLNKKTPCREDGVCHHCLADECVCCMTVVTRKSVVPGRIKVILVAEDLGF